MTMESITNLRTGVLFASEMLVPGASNLLQGKLRNAGLHFVAALAARAAFGPAGALVVAANSFVSATRGGHLLQGVGFGAPAAGTGGSTTGA